MLNSTVLDVGIGLIFVYLVLGLMCTTVNEWLAQCFKMRAETLRQGLHALLDGPLARPSAARAGNVEIKPENLNFPRLLQRLIAPGDRLAAALDLDPANTPEPDVLASVDAAVKEALAARLNRLLDLPDLYARIDTARISAATLTAAQKQAGGNLRLANYNLLAEAYPDEIGGLIHAFYNHPLIKSLSKPGQHPSYVASRTFVTAIMDILSGGTVDGVSIDSIKAAIVNLPEGDAKRSLATLTQGADDVVAFQKNLEHWYDDTMDRVSGWYKKKVQIVTAVVAVGIAIFANADTVQISRKLFVNPTVRAKIVAEAGVPLTPQEKADVGELTGWSAEFTTFNAMNGKSSLNDAFPGFELVRSPSLFVAWLSAIVPVHLLGWFLTAVAVSLGAPFWFDTLNKFMNIRSAGTAPNEKGQDKSKA